MNAIAWDPIAGELRDPSGGREDIRRRLIRAVGDPVLRFGEDGLRPLRAVRFAAQLDYSIERRTLESIPGALGVVRLVSAERVAEEMSKILAVPRPRRALRLLDGTGLLGAVVPGLARLRPRARAHAVEVASDSPAHPPALRFAALLHLLAPVEAEQALVALRLPNRVAAEVTALLSERSCLALSPGVDPPRTPGEVRRWLSRVGPERALSLRALWSADARQLPAAARRHELEALRRLGSAATRAQARRPPLAIGDLALGGDRVMRLLGVGPGPEVGEALRFLLERVLDDPSRNRPAALAGELRSWWSRRPSRGPAA
jgi:tRNA nucleotidyltransferase (CCA-adding enzyme)